ncbi:MAG: VWA-like domain-containing protein [Sellimonas sp.]|nr:VWA-like domain-containing protein [Drancourtella massiliensis]MEE0781494.1 VWA-like domain-containing protein [Sellimonas sp.]
MKMDKEEEMAETISEEQAARMNALGKEILRTARNELYLKMRYLDVALSSLRFQMDGEIGSIGTDGQGLYFHPGWLGGAYREDRKNVNRAYLHIVLHCLFGHLYLRGKRDPLFWDLACNIAVESIIDSLSYPCVRRAPSWLRKDVYRRLKSSTKVLTAQKIYKSLTAWGMSEKKRMELEAEFGADSHLYWPDPEKNKKRPPNETENNWKQISEQMELNLDTFAQEEASASGDLLEELRVANKKRYDYREFLRKFSVWREEIGVDDDSFDYAFYHYGLSMYGNMPLIEPQETKEVKKIEEFVIVVDTSMSCSGDLVRKFLEETYDVLSENESFFRKVHIRILQCDEQVQEDVRIERQEDWERYMQELKLYGGGGTDFRPAFAYIDSLIEQGAFQNLRGVIYFTDGYGTYPSRMPSYETAFVFIDDGSRDIRTPAWAIRLVLDEAIFMESEEE